MRGRGREGGREGVREEGREGGREGVREEGREGEREGEGILDSSTTSQCPVC